MAYVRNNQTQLTFWVLPDERKKLNEYARKNKKDKTAIIKQALENFYKQNDLTIS